MKLRKTLAAAGALAIASGLTFVAQPAQAACDPGTQGPCSADTTINVTLTSTGTFSIGTDAASASASLANTLGGNTTVTMPKTTVTDNRGTLAGWTVTGNGEDLVTPDVTPSVAAANRTIPATGIVWTTGAITNVSGLLTGVSAGAGGSFATANFPIATGLSLAGNGVYEYTPTVAVTLPATTNLISGTYSGVVTQSLA